LLGHPTGGLRDASFGVLAHSRSDSCSSGPERDVGVHRLVLRGHAEPPTVGVGKLALLVNIVVSVHVCGAIAPRRVHTTVLVVVVGLRIEVGLRIRGPISGREVTIMSRIRLLLILVLLLLLHLLLGRNL